MAKNSRIEEHILSHLPKNQFHSCLLTTFSFDFNYFYHEVRSQLNRADIINTNVLVDDAMLQHYLGTMTGYAHDSVKKFAVTGVPLSKGVFHPKLGLFFGDKERGFLIIGSGNLTSCGHGKNHELWGAFHIDGPTDPKAPLFKKAWIYLHGFKQQMAGISRHKIDWIEQHAGWVEQIPDTEDDQWVPLDNEVEAQLLINSGSSIWNKLSGIMSTEQIEDVTVISPFFDVKGQTLASLCQLAGDAEVHLIAQKASCAFPEMDNFEIPKNLVFHDWDSIYEEGPSRYVHAKLIYVKTADVNYCLIGSANLSSAGMGANTKEAQNEEASLLLRTTKDLLKEHLGLESRGAIITAETIATEGKSIEGRFMKTEKPLRINSVDRYATSLHIYMEQIPDLTDVELRLFNGWEEQISYISMSDVEYSPKHTCYKFGFAGDGEIFFAQLYNSKAEEAVSNKVMVHDAKALLNTNPDPANKKLDKAIAQIESGQSDLLSLLQYIDPEDIIDTKKRPGSGGGKGEDKEVKHQDGSGEVIGYDQFTEQEGKEEQEVNELHSRVGHTIDRILELVRFLLQKASEQVADNQDEDEEAEKENVEGTEGRDDDKVKAHDPVIPPQKQSAFISNQKKLKQFFDKYIKTQAALIKKKVAPTKLDHSLFAVVMHLLIDFYKKPVMVEDPETKEYHRKYLLDCHFDFFDKTDYCRYVAEIVGQYSRLFTYSKEGDLNQYEKSVLDNIKRKAYWNAIFALGLAASTKKTDQKGEAWIWELFMNIRHLCGVEGCSVRLNASEHISSLVNIVETEDRDKLFNQIMFFWEKHEGLYECFTKVEGYKKNLSEVGRRVYSDTFGFCHISSCEASGQRKKIELSRPGYPPDIEAQEFPLKNKFISEMVSLKPLS